MVAREGHPGASEAVVDRNSSAELVIHTAAGFHARRGDSLLLQYSHAAYTWELTAPVVDCLDGRLVLGHSSQIRLINRRRFARVPVRRPAMVAALSFHAGDKEADLLRFLPAEVTEIAGPGLCLECRLAVQVGQSIVVRIKLDEGSLQAPARVQRVKDLGDGRYSMAVEMTALEAEEAAELVRRTKEATRDADRSTLSAKAAAPAVSAGWRSDNG
jgi:hypothetical protein